MASSYILFRMLYTWYNSILCSVHLPFLMCKMKILLVYIIMCLGHRVDANDAVTLCYIWHGDNNVAATLYYTWHGDTNVAVTFCYTWHGDTNMAVTLGYTWQGDTNVVAAAAGRWAVTPSTLLTLLAKDELLTSEVCEKAGHFVALCVMQRSQITSVVRLRRGSVLQEQLGNRHCKTTAELN